MVHNPNMLGSVKLLFSEHALIYISAYRLVCVIFKRRKDLQNYEQFYILVNACVLLIVIHIQNDYSNDCHVN